MEFKKKEKKFLIVGTGRTGSSLLSAILLKSGADFGLRSKDIWDRQKGDFEHSLIHEAYKWQSRVEKIDQSILPNYFTVSFFNNICNKKMEQLLTEVDYVKSSQLVWLVHRAKYKLGFEVKVIGVYRNFSDYVISRYKKYGRSLDHWRKEWLEVNKTLFLQAQIIPSLLLSYEEIVGRNETKWIDRLALFTNISREKLSFAANEIVDKKSHKRIMQYNFEDDDTRRVYNRLKMFSNKSSIDNR
ncbi:MAG: hypothetical protein GF349_01960 [Candidatus Magasanikbacteria bacterium]|nr:hypothetical protein [Candidatus Magasanikbacteria bacterium]